MTPASDVFDEVSPHVGHSGSCSEKEFIRAVNAATSMLWRRGDWKGSEIYGAICSPGCRFTLPWEWQIIRDAWKGKYPIPVRDQWYEALTEVGIRDCCDCNCFGELVDTGQFTSTAATHPAGWKVSVEFQYDDPDGEVTIYGKDGNGVQVHEKIGNGITETAFYTIDGVAKDVTNSPVRLDSVNWLDTTDRKFLALYHPRQKNPKMAIFKVLSPGCDTLLVRAKKRFIPIGSLDDPLLIDNVTALQFALQALNHQGKENQLYLDNLNLAEEALNEDLEDQRTEAFIPIDVELGYKTENLMAGIYGGGHYRSTQYGDI